MTELQNDGTEKAASKQSEFKIQQYRKPTMFLTNQKEMNTHKRNKRCMANGKRKRKSERSYKIFKNPE